MKALITCAAVLALLGSVATAQIVTVTTAGYCEDFEAGAGAWSSATTSGTDTWVLGTPTGTVINAAASGVNCFSVDDAGSTGYSNNTFTSLSATFDLTAFGADPLFSMNNWMDSEGGFDGCNVEIDTGSGFTVLGAVGDPGNWYDDTGVDGLGFGVDGWSADTGGYVNRSHVLNGAAGTVCTIRINFGSDSSVNSEDGAAIDDIKIVKAPTIVTSGTPYCEDFEAAQTTWEDMSGLWVVGTPAGGTINAAASGVNAAHVVPYANSQGGSFEANFDLSSFGADPVFEMNLWFETEGGFDGANVEIDTGSGYAVLGGVGTGVNWYNDASVNNGTLGNLAGWAGSNGGYVNVRHILDGTAGNGNVGIRVNFGSDGSVVGGDGVAIDDIKIFDQFANLPGTNEDLFTRYSVNGGALITPLNFLNDVVAVFPGDLVSVGHDSGGTWQGVGELVVLGSVGATGPAPVTILPNFYLGAAAVFGITTPILGPVQLPFGGFNYGFTNPGGAAAGNSLYLQGLVLDSSAANGLYASTNMLELQLN